MAFQRRVIGSVHLVALSDGSSVHAVALPEADFAFLDTRFAELDKLSSVLAYPMLFRVAVHKSAWNTDRWKRLGKVDLPSSMMDPQPTFIQDSLDPRKLEIYLRGEIRPASEAECVGLERCAVWGPEHVEDRLLDHYQGKPNKWLISISLK